MAHFLLPYKTVGRNWRHCDYTIHVMARASDGSHRYLEGKVKVGHVENFCGGDFLHSPAVELRTMDRLDRNPEPDMTLDGDWDIDTASTLRAATSGPMTQQQWESLPVVGDRRFWWGPDEGEGDLDKMFYMLAGVTLSHIIASGARGGVYFAGPTPDRDVTRWPAVDVESPSYNCYRLARGMAAMGRTRHPFLCSNIETLGGVWGRNTGWIKADPRRIKVPPLVTFTNPNSGRAVAHMTASYNHRNGTVSNAELFETLAPILRAYKAMYRKVSRQDWRIH